MYDCVTDASIKIRYFGSSPTIEEQARKKENGILHTVGNNEIQEQNARQEAIQKRYT